MAGAKNHQYHILPPSIWPLFGAMAALVLASGGIMWMHSMPSANLVFFAGVAGILITFFGWWSDVIKEAHQGDHTPIVQLHLRYGMILFIASEVMFFVGWFWAWFDFSLFPSTVEAVGGQWPPKGQEVFDAFKLPLMNTLILLLSGCTVTWAHHGLLHNERGGAMKGLWGLIGVGENDSVKKGLWLTVILGISFTLLQAVEYSEAPFPFKAASDHVDASKKSVAEGKTNAALSGMEDLPIRWMIDDAGKFVAREVRRGRRYDGIILDPPKWGRGPNGEVWKLEEGLPGLIADTRKLLDAESRFLFLTVYAVRMSALAIGELVRQSFGDLGGKVEAGELTVREEARGLMLPTAIFARWSR